MALFKKQLRAAPADHIPGPQDIYDQHLSWGEKNRSLRTLIGLILLAFAVAGWVVAGVLSFSVAQLFPLVRTEVVPLIVDKNTGYMETVTSLDKDRSSVSEMQAVRASFVGNYVIRRETYDPRYLSDNFDMIALWSEPNSGAFKDYEEWINPSNPRGPVKTLGATGDIRPEILSVNPLNASTMAVRFETRERQRGGDVVNRWSATVRFRQINLPASNRVRLYNPLGFVVTEYVKVPETMPSGLAP
ncbi:type IV secretion system protein [Rhizobium sp. P32RR-XVIII]|uniref:virB8 family protein n=1 Tax=Rhizobium sp. P32RR-XVIII TaxID=2726738 RepID=UPI0014575A10|nr:type IV secretion system protein [Rhizobium sp. P32RR-XVIII]NLS07489.1 type IV secretion system protein [Rhizobium sp. P32RR-XVIII]